MILRHKIHQKTTLIYYIVYHAIGKNINSIQNEIVVFFADTGNAASGYRNPDSIENEIRKYIIYKLDLDLKIFLTSRLTGVVVV